MPVLKAISHSYWLHIIYWLYVSVRSTRKVHFWHRYRPQGINICPRISVTADCHQKEAPAWVCHLRLEFSGPSQACLVRIQWPCCSGRWKSGEGAQTLAANERCPIPTWVVLTPSRPSETPVMTYEGILNELRIWCCRVEEQKSSST